MTTDNPILPDPPEKKPAAAATPATPAGGEVEQPVIEAPPVDRGPTVPPPHERSSETDRRIRAAVERMFEDVRNPYEAVIAASQEARRINEIRLKARSILNQAMEQTEEPLADMPFVPRTAEEEEPEVKPTNEAMEKLAVGLVQYNVDGDLVNPPSYYDGEIDFQTIFHDDEDEAATPGSTEPLG